MNKHTLIAAIVGILTLSSCEKLDLDFSQLSPIMSTETIAITGASELLKAYPDSIDILKQIAEKFSELSTKDTLTKAEVQTSLEQSIINSKAKAKTEILVAVKTIIDNVFTSDEIDVSAHKQKFEDIVSGINAAIRYFEMTNSQVVESK